MVNPRPKIRYACALKCVYCGQTRLQKPGSWFVFAQGCPQCDYRYEREAGYFTGASWMIAYPVLALMGLSLSLLFKLVLFPKLPTLVILLLVSLLSLFIAVLLIPYCMSAWMCVDHFLHPLDQNDSYTQPPKH